MEIVNQNNVNVEQARLDELKQLKADNQSILESIQAERSALRQEKAAFATWVEEQKSEIAEARKLLAREGQKPENPNQPLHG